MDKVVLGHLSLGQMYQHRFDAIEINLVCFILGSSSPFSSNMMSLVSVPCHTSELNKIPLSNIVCLHLNPACTFQCPNGDSFIMARILLTLLYPFDILLSIFGLQVPILSKMSPRYFCCSEFFILLTYVVSGGTENC